MKGRGDYSEGGRKKKKKKQKREKEGNKKKVDKLKGGQMLQLQ